MLVDARRLKTALAVAVSALGAAAFGGVSLVEAVYFPWACGLVCATPPWHSIAPSLLVIALGVSLFAIAALLVPTMFGGRSAYAGSGMLLVVLGAIILEQFAAALFADFSVYPLDGNATSSALAVLITLTFGAVGLSLPIVGAHLWWIAAEQTEGSHRPTPVWGRPLIREGVVLLVLGAVGASVDVALGGCMATGPCQPNPLVPLIFPLLVSAVGMGLMVSMVRTRPPQPVG